MNERRDFIDVSDLLNYYISVYYSRIKDDPSKRSNKTLHNELIIWCNSKYTTRLKILGWEGEALFKEAIEFLIKKK